MATIRKRKNRYQVQIRIKNYTASKTFSSLKSARLWASFEESRILKESNPQFKYRPLNLAEILVHYQQHILNDKETNHPDKWIVKAFLKLEWIKKPIDQLSPQDVAKYRDQRLKEIKATSLHRQFFVLRNALSLADKEWDWDVPVDLFRRIRVPIKPLQVFRRISAVQQEKLLYTCLKAGREDIYLILLTALRIGLLRSEILSLCWKDIDLDEKLINVHKTKNGYHRAVPITKDLHKEFSKFEKLKEVRVFKLSVNAVRLAFERIRQKLKD